MASIANMFDPATILQAMVPKPACLPAATLATAQSLCVQKSGTGQQAVAGWFRGFGDTDYTAAINADPCGWASIPSCAPPPPKPALRNASTVMPASILNQTPEPPPATVSVTPAAVPVVLPPPPPKYDPVLIVGGVLLAALAVGGVIYFVEKR
jgi:hypothetical protein